MPGILASDARRGHRQMAGSGHLSNPAVRENARTAHPSLRTAHAVRVAGKIVTAAAAAAMAAMAANVVATEIARIVPATAANRPTASAKPSG